MKILVDDITSSAKAVQFAEQIEDLNEVYAARQNRDFRFPSFLNVDLVYYRSGQEILFQGTLRGTLDGCCSRCLKDYSFDLEKPFNFILGPGPTQSDRRVRELSRADLGLSYYSTDEIDLAPLIKEQVLLALPTRPLCKETCRGLCGGCGVNLNHEPCVCNASEGEPRTAIFHRLKLGR